MASHYGYDPKETAANGSSSEGEEGGGEAGYGNNDNNADINLGDVVYEKGRR